MYWAIRCAVEAMQKVLPSVTSIWYVDHVLLTMVHPRLDEDCFVDSLRQQWNDLESAEEAMTLMEPAFYRFGYYERLGFQFQDQTAEQRTKLAKRNANLLFEM